MRWRIDRPADREGGFLLLETLVAFVIASVALVVLYRAAFDGVAEVALARRSTAALDRAESRLASLRVFAPLHRYVHAGADGDGFSFRETATPMGGGGPVIAVRLGVVESWDGGRRSVVLDSLVAVPAQ